jgi:mono/diheme cytochrome c family protein
MVRTASNTCRREWGAHSLVFLSSCLVICTSFALVGCELSGRPNPADRPVPADQVLSFKILYGQSCAGCHGADGKLGPAPPLNDALFRAIVSEAELDDIVTKGRSKTLMPAFGKENGGTLTAAQIQVLVHEIKGIPYKVITKQEGGLASMAVVAERGGISPTWGQPPEPPAATPSYRQPFSNVGSSGTGNSVNGATVFARACADCHGDSGQGIVEGNDTRNTVNDTALLKLTSDQVLRRYIITGRPDLGMPNFAGARPGNPHFAALTDQEVADLVALLASWRQRAVPDDDFVKD